MDILIIAIIAAFVIAVLFLKTLGEMSASSVRLAQERLRSDQQIAVATIAGNLISAMLANPKYWQDYQSLQSDAMRTILNLSMSTFEFERRISEIDKQKMEMDVFAYDGRRQFIELAWDIYQETGRQNPNRE